MEFLFCFEGYKLMIINAHLAYCSLVQKSSLLQIANGWMVARRGTSGCQGVSNLPRGEWQPFYHCCLAGHSRACIPTAWEILHDPTGNMGDGQFTWISQESFSCSFSSVCSSYCCDFPFVAIRDIFAMVGRHCFILAALQCIPLSATRAPV